MRPRQVSVLYAASLAVLNGACGSSGPPPADGAAAVDTSNGSENDGGGADAGTCATCFLHGEWSIDNLSPCFVTGADPSKVSVAISSMVNGGMSQCPTDFSTAPAEWSTDRLKIDCAGHYRLCYTIKAGDPSRPSADDCVVAQSCVEGDATSSTAAQAWPPLPGWITSQSATPCAQSFYDGGGYGEESVTGTAAGCGAVGKTFTRVRYCPLACNGTAPPPVCATCMAGGSGMF